MTRICVTGASGKAGVATVHELLANGYEVRGTDVVSYSPDLPPIYSRHDFVYMRADLTDYGDAIDVLTGVDAVVHLANIPAPNLFPPARTLQTNTVMNGNVFLAAAQLKLTKVVWASSETTLGLDFSDEIVPEYAPLDEAHYPHPRTTYSLSKVLGETQAAHISEWSGIPFIGLRLSNVITPAAYQDFPQAWADHSRRQFNLWSYIDVRDAAMACRLALEANVTGASSYIIAATDSAMPVESAELMAAHYPNVPLTRPLVGFESLQSIAKAAAELGFRPAHSWRDEVQAPAS